MVADPPRPRDLTPRELGFVRRPPVRWLSPRLLAATTLRVVLAELFGAYLDKRELQGALSAEVYRHDDAAEIWWDYVADVGDGFDATYSVAWLVAQPALTVDGHQLPRADVLVMGGDEVYPTPSWRQYEDRCKGPYRAALPEASPQPSLYALPGNHDWYDGLTAFLRLFGKDERIGGWQTQQARSYFALRLPHRWWVFAIDSQLDAYIDDPQLKYFQSVAAELTPDDRVIVCLARPTWVYANTESPEAYDTVDYFVRKVIEPTGAAVPLLLAGDAHHYARYSGADTELVTCGGGGAYLSATHHLPERIVTPPPSTLVRSASAAQEFTLAATYPAQAQSRRYAWGVFARLPWRSRGFVALLATIQTLVMLAYASAGSRVVTLASLAATVLVIGGTVAFAMGESPGRGPRQWVCGFAHAVPQLALAVGGAMAWQVSPFVDLPRPLPILAVMAVYAPLAGLISAWIVAAYVLVASRFGVNLNELFAGQGIDDAKSFLRIHLDTAGHLTIYPIAIDRVGRRWRADPAGSANASWIAPEQPLRVRFAESPVTLRPQVPPRSRPAP